MIEDNKRLVKVLIVANVAKEHINKFHIPTIVFLQSKGWLVDVACCVDSEVPAGDHVYKMSWKRTPFTFQTFVGINELKVLIEKNKYDIVYCHTPVGGLVTRLASRKARKLGTKVVYCAHGLHFYKGAPLINWLLYYPLEWWMAYMTDMFITINREDYDRVKSCFNKKMLVRLLPGIGVNNKRLDVIDRDAIRKRYREGFGIPTDAVVLIYVAEIIDNKNQQMLIRTLKLLHDQGKDYYLLLPGPDHSNGACRKLAVEMKLVDYVKFLGWRSDVGELLASSDICVASSIREGFGINLIEALYCHLPVVAVSNRGHRAIIKDGENGFLVPLNDYSLMAQRISELTSDKNLYNRFANIDVSIYRSDNVVEIIYKYLREVVAI